MHSGMEQGDSTAQQKCNHVVTSYIIVCIFRGVKNTAQAVWLWTSGGPCALHNLYNLLLRHCVRQF